MILHIDHPSNGELKDTFKKHGDQDQSPGQRFYLLGV